MNPVRSALAIVLVAATAARAQETTPIAPFVEPPFQNLCVLHHFGEAVAPPVDGCTDDPLCVEYEKRDITLSNGGAIDFTAAEPARFAIAIPKCRYWQQDHWRIQINPGDVPLVQWDGSYWFNKGNGTGAARMRNFAIQGQPADPGPAADFIEPFSAELADAIRTYGDSPEGGGGATFLLDYGDPTCAADAASPCDNDPGVAMARARIEEECDCASAESRRAHYDCASAVAQQEVDSGRLPAECEDGILSCAKNSTCGRPVGAVTCFLTRSNGETRCVIRRNASRCRAPSGGSASPGSGSSCCDPRVMEGCQ
jgi:hypothetical protein